MLGPFSHPGRSSSCLVLFFQRANSSLLSRRARKHRVNKVLVEVRKKSESSRAQTHSWNHVLLALALIIINYKNYTVSYSCKLVLFLDEIVLKHTFEICPRCVSYEPWPRFNSACKSLHLCEFNFSVLRDLFNFNSLCLENGATDSSPRSAPSVPMAQTPHKNRWRTALNNNTLSMKPAIRPALSHE